MHIVRKDEQPEPTAAEKLAAEIVELREDVDGLMDRLYRRPQRSPERMTKERALRWKRVLALVEAAVAGATKVIPSPQPNLAIEIAKQKGWDAHVAGMRRKELPPEYRNLERAAEADAWLTGWDRYAEFLHDRGAR
jgi:ribosome modulation factor